MRLSPFHLFVVLIAWCVGFQSTAAAMGMRCAHGKMEMSESLVAMPAGIHHAGMAMNHAEPAADQHHHMGPDAKSADTNTGAAKIGCQCGCACTTIGCVGGGPGMVSLGANSFILAAPAVFTLQKARSGLRSAHRLDLLRPPSTL